MKVILSQAHSTFLQVRVMKEEEEEEYRSKRFGPRRVRAPVQLMIIFTQEKDANVSSDAPAQMTH